MTDIVPDNKESMNFWVEIILSLTSPTTNPLEEQQDDHPNQPHGRPYHRRESRWVGLHSSSVLGTYLPALIFRRYLS